MGLWTYAGDVDCPTCKAKPFEPCVYVWTAYNQQRGCVGKPIYRKGYPYFHNERQYEQSVYNHNYIFGPGVHDQLAAWLARFGDIFSESA